ncbi:hypothetical protein QBC38DRAFT_117504 [Podospora fimiseda]|uniref:Uncharacterized protein n=1 Tax=Podospora fimiseda TaxID=252190 RepID=A0AAN6YMZ8_9PEZI|nr:hypothetical protein QBC38DRAFT_117504 [Podospora fimiseda]
MQCYLWWWWFFLFPHINLWAFLELRQRVSCSQILITFLCFGASSLLSIARSHFCLSSCTHLLASLGCRHLRSCCHFHCLPTVLCNPGVTSSWAATPACLPPLGMHWLQRL